MTMFRGLKEAMNKCLNEDCADLKKQLDGIMKKTQDITEIKSLKKTQTEINLERRDSVCQTKASEVSLTSRLKDIEKRYSSLKDKVEDMDSLVKENVKS